MISDLTAQDWDVIVIGAGLGGGVAARALAEAGLKVLILEQGAPGYRAEETPLDLDMADPVARRLRGFWPDPVRATLEGRALDQFAPLGAGPGGSSVFYAATLERPEPHDLDDSAACPHPTGGWPLSFSAFTPYLDRAEALFHVVDAPLTKGDAAMIARLRTGGIDAGPLRSALRHLPGCAGCLGRKCPRDCKMDGRSAGVEPALATGNAILATDAEVVAIHGRDRVSHVEIAMGGSRHHLSARAYVLAGGALGSARLILASASEYWPGGFANGSGMAGRNLMFHLNEVLAVWPGRTAPFDAPSKAVGFRDLIWHDGQRGGMVQAMGLAAGYGEVLHAMRQAIARSPTLARLPGARDLARLPAHAAARILGRAQVFVGLLEDLPYADNRVMFDIASPRRIAFRYGFSPELLARRRGFRRAVRHAFRGHRRLFLTRQPELNLGHPSGTLRMGADPATSMVDATGRAHGADNLWVADSSVFPTSMGVNPSLTIAAHALHMAEHLTKRLKETP